MIGSSSKVRIVSEILDIDVTPRDRCSRCLPFISLSLCVSTICCHDHDECHCHILLLASCSSFGYIALPCPSLSYCICASCHYPFSRLIICLVVFILLCLHHVRYSCLPMHLSHASSPSPFLLLPFFLEVPLFPSLLMFIFSLQILDHAYTLSVNFILFGVVLVRLKMLQDWNIFKLVLFFYL